jgi:excisionase family DNA binding protein
MDPDELLTIREAADMLNVHPDTLRRWEKAGRLVPLRTPTGHRRYRRGDIALQAYTQTTDGSAAGEAPGASMWSRSGRPAPQSGEAAGAGRSSDLFAAQSRERPWTAERIKAMTPVSGEGARVIYPRLQPVLRGRAFSGFVGGAGSGFVGAETPQQRAQDSYLTGALKQDPVTLAVAVRTAADASGDHAWGIMTVDRGGYMANYEEVADWPDIPWGKGSHRKRKGFHRKRKESGETEADLPQVSKSISLIVGTDGSQRSFGPGHDVVIGQDLRADVRVVHPSVSRAHVLLRFDGDRWMAIDNGSLNGTFVDGRRVPWVVIGDGQSINIGDPDGPRVTFTVQ